MRGAAVVVLVGMLVAAIACGGDGAAEPADDTMQTDDVAATTSPTNGNGTGSGPPETTGRDDIGDASGRSGDGDGPQQWDGSPTSTTRPPVAGVHQPQCVIEVRDGESLSVIADSFEHEAITVQSLQEENAIADPDELRPGDYLDVCVGNGIDDIGGGSNAPPETPQPVPGARHADTGVAAQQRQLNELFGPLGMPELDVDGISGALTQQQLCAARSALNMPVSRGDMASGSPEEQVLMSADELPVPAAAPVANERWVLIDQRCQVLFAGAGDDRLTFAFATSTGEPDHPTRNQTASRAFRFDPALANGGWHDSADFPVSADNPLNGNMYKPIYFDEGQAIHGATQIPPSPASKGCARLRLPDQDALIEWLGLDGADGPMWKQSHIDLAVTVQGSFYESE